MKIALAASDDEIAACFPVMAELRHQLKAATFVSLIRELQSDGSAERSRGYGAALLAWLADQGGLSDVNSCTWTQGSSAWTHIDFTKRT